MTRHVVFLAIVGLAIPAMAAPGDTLVGDPFVLGYNGWNEVPQTLAGGGPTNWGINLTVGGLQEGTEARVSTGAANADTVKSVMMVNDFGTPSEFTLSSQMVVWDDDGCGLMFGYQDVDNWYRVSFRKQANGNLGYPAGMSVQKNVNGTITSLGTSTSFVPTISHMGGPTAGAPLYAPFNVDVKVTSSGWGVYIDGGTTPILSGTDAVPAGKVGVHNWYQSTQSTGNDPAYTLWGTQWKSVAVKDASGSAVFQDNFDASPVKWRKLQMVQPNNPNWVKQTDDYGNFHLDFRNRTIVDDSNGFEWATAAAPNVDFVGPGVVVDTPGSANFGDIEMKTRLACVDNDGIGLLVRVQDDDSFYRVNFCNEAMGTGTTRAPQGLSVQKCDDGVWTELFRDDQGNPLFVYDTGLAGAFDVRVQVVGNQIMVRVIKDPDSATPTIIDYPVITDSSNPLMTGTVGFANWGSGGYTAPALWSAFGGVAGTPLVIEIPEPATMGLLAAFGGAVFFGRRRRQSA